MNGLTIPNTQLHVSRLCLGTADMGAGISPDNSFAVLDEFVAQGGNFIDTAHVYSNWVPGTFSTSEKLIGRWLKARGNRDQIVLATKGAHPELNTMHISRLSPAEIGRDVAESLDYLQTNRIDLYWLHRDDSVIPVGEIVDALDEQVRAGRIRYSGGSNWSTARLQAALDYSARTGKQPFVANQPLWSLAAPNLADHFDQTIVALDAAGQAFHKHTQMAVVPFSSQAHGFFSKLAADRQATISPDDWTLYNNPLNFKRLGRVRELAAKHGVSINEVVLSYLLSQPFPTIPILGSKRIDQVHDSWKALNLRLTPDELTYLEAHDESH